jgi:WhiB family transcriptional regulator, redox-sensing transcriptional regulator
LTHPNDWQVRALCRGNHSHLFFPPSTFERKEDRERRELRAKAICDVCPVKTDCLNYANAIHEPFGIWGGLTEVERRDEFVVATA